MRLRSSKKVEEFVIRQASPQLPVERRQILCWKASELSRGTPASCKVWEVFDVLLGDDQPAVQA